MNVKIDDESKCCACMACVNVCPVDAVQPIENDLGFVYPQVDASRCINCGRCVDVCVFNKPEFIENKPISACSLTTRDKDALLKSSSGGAFTVLSDLALSKGGVVAGAVLDENFLITHKIAETKEARDLMRGSLYTQSSTDKIFREVKKVLNDGKLTFFVGLPCQVAGLISYLGKRYDNLITVDLLCHGTPSASFFRAHIRWLEKKYGKKARSYSFRNKNFGWTAPTIERITFQDGKHLSNWYVQSYNRFFMSNVSLRPSCFNCSYRKQTRSGDITLGDFWGIERLTGKKNVLGESFVLINTEKGRAFFDQATSNAVVKEFHLKDVVYRVSLKRPSSKISTEDFWQTYRIGGYEALVQKYFDNSIYLRIRLLLKKIVQKIKLQFAPTPARR